MTAKLNSKIKKPTKKLRSSISTYRARNGVWFCNLKELSEHYAKSYGNVPVAMTDARAQEIHLLARAYISLKKEFLKGVRREKLASKKSS